MSMAELVARIILSAAAFLFGLGLFLGAVFAAWEKTESYRHGLSIRRREKRACRAAEKSKRARRFLPYCGAGYYGKNEFPPGLYLAAQRLSKNVKF